MIYSPTDMFFAYTKRHSLPQISQIHADKRQIGQMDLLKQMTQRKTVAIICGSFLMNRMPRVKKAAKKTVTTHQKKASGAKRDTAIIKFNPILFKMHLKD